MPLELICLPVWFYVAARAVRHGEEYRILKGG